MKLLADITYLQSPFSYSGVLYQARIHVENMLSAIPKELIRDLWNDVIGKHGMFNPIIEELLTPQEKVVQQTLTLLWNDAKIQGLETEIQLVINEVLDA